MKNDQIKQILEQIQAPEPNEAARKAAISVALAEFDKINQKTTQGSSITSRLMDIFNQQIRGINMKKAYYGTSLTAIAVICGVLTYGEFSSVKDLGPTKQTAFLPVRDSLPQAIAIPEPEAVANAASKDEKFDYKPSPKKPHALLDKSVVDRERVDFPAPPPPSVIADPMPLVNAQNEVDSLSKGLKEESKNYRTDAKMKSSQGIVAREMAPTSPSLMSNVAPAPGLGGMVAPPSDYIQQQQYQGNDKFEKTKTNAIKLVAQEPVSTFSIDVDTSSYSFIRRTLNMGTLPQKDAVRVEEMVNYFDYNYPLPETRNKPFKPSITVLPSPWHAGNKLVHIGIKGFDIAASDKQHSNLVFLIDTSGSMNEPDKLPLLINSLSMLVNTLDENDTVSIVTYAGWAGTALEPTKIKDKAKILNVLHSLQSGGGTAGAAGIEQAYSLAEQNFDKNGVNRVILATDGDFNVGITDPSELQTYIEKKRDTGIFLSVLGFGQGNYNDALMQKLAQNGNGNAAYIDNINEARKVLVQEASSTLFPIAKDVKIQVEFNKDKVSEYRLIGYETRLLNREDFNNDKVDAGEIGSGHAVTAIYEITPKGGKGLVDESRYEKSTDVASDKTEEYGFLKIRYKLPKESTSKLLTTPITIGNEVATVEKAPQEVRFATAVAAFGQMLHGDSYIGDFKYEDVEKLATGAKGEDKFGYRAEFINLVKTAHAVPGQTKPAEPVVYE